VDDPAKFCLVEIYQTPEGPPAHKAAPHYAAWRDAVGDMMATPRTADKYVAVYPWAGLWGTSAASRRSSGAAASTTGGSGGGLDGEGDAGKGMALADGFLSLGASGEEADGSSAAAGGGGDDSGGGKDDRGDGSEDTKVITHVYVTVKPGAEDEFIQCSIANAASSVLEPGNLRFDVLQNAGDPCKFVLVEVYATRDGPAAHKNTPHYTIWRREVEELMAAPREARRYVAKFPVAPTAWKMTLSGE